MQIKFVHAITSVEWSFRPGEVAEIDDELALKFIASGTARAVEPEIETATAAPPENAAKRTSRSKSN